MKRIIFVSVILYLAVVCGSYALAIEYSGMIVNDIGRPAANATISVSNLADTNETFTAVTDTTGLFSFIITDIAGSSPVPFRLYGNFPNPFNPTTRISYSIDESADVMITIFNVLGQVVRTIDHGFRQPGFYTAVWDGRDDLGKAGSAGVYLYRLTAGDKSSTSKMLMVDSATGSWISRKSTPTAAFKASEENLYLITVTHPDAETLTLGPLTINETTDTVLTIDRIKNKMQLIHKNTYMRGTDKRYYPHVWPEHPVQITHDFLMDKYEVTTAMFCDVMNHAVAREAIELVEGVGRNVEGDPQKLFLYERPGEESNLSVRIVDGRLVPLDEKVKLPVSFVSWYGAMFFCYERNIIEGFPQAIDVNDWSYDIYSEGYRLPTDAEWELAAKWTDNREYAFGPDPGHYKPMNVQLNEDGFNDTLSPVGWFSPQGDSHDGCCDLSGNVYEWTSDWQGEYNIEWVDVVQVDPTGKETGLNKVCRGGSANGCFRSARTYDKANIRIDETLHNIGIRSVRVVND